MIDKENKKTLGGKTHEGKILIYCGGNILLLRVGFTRLVLRRTPPPPALVSRVWCGDVYPFSHVKSTRLLALVGNPWHETQAIKQGVSSAEAVRMQSRSSARPLPFHTGSVCSARLNSVFCTEWANSNLILNTIGLDLLLE